MTRRTFLSASLAVVASPVIGTPHRLSVAPGIGAQAGLAALPPGHFAGVGIGLAYAQALREASEALERLGAQGPTQAEMIGRMERHPA